MSPKQESTDAGNSSMPKIQRRVLPLSEKVKVLDLMRKEKTPMLRLLWSTVRTNLVLVKLQRERNVCWFCCWNSNPQTTKVLATVHVREREIHVTFIKVDSVFEQYWGWGAKPLALEHLHITLQSALHICGSASEDSANLGICGTMARITEKAPRVSGPAWYKLLFKGLLHAVLTIVFYY